MNRMYQSKAVKQTQYKKLAPNALRFKYQNLKSCNSHEKNETKNTRLSVFSVSSIDEHFDVFCFVFSCGLQDFKF